MESAGHGVHPDHTPPAVDGILSHPLRAVSFFTQVAGAPFSEVWFWNARSQRVAAGAIAAVSGGTYSGPTVQPARVSMAAADSR
jgi:hypothetical protein